MELMGKTAVVTGGSRGIGKGIALPKEDAGQAVVFLCSEKAAYITGEVLRDNGGLVM